MRKNPLSQIEIQLAARLREAREAAGFSRPLLARRAGMDSSRVAKYEHALVAVPYHIGARLFSELNTSQRWAVTGAGPRECYVKVLPEIEKLIPRAMSFADAYQRMLGEEFEYRMATAAKAHGVEIEDLMPHCFTEFGPLGEHPAAHWRRVSLALLSHTGASIIDHSTQEDAERFLAKVQALGSPLLKKLAKDNPRQSRTPERDAKEQDEIKRVFSAKLAGWIPPGHGRKKKR